MTWVKHSLRFLFVTVGIIALTSIGIDATQYLSGSPSALGILADRATEGTCPDGMVFVEDGTRDFCVDEFEVSASDACTHADPVSALETAANIREKGCEPRARAEAMPWTHVTYHQAAELCAKVGKRLPTHQEWYRSALGSQELMCVVRAGGVQATSEERCESTSGVNDTIGNVWEWVAAEATDGTYDGRVLPAAGYVTAADAAGVAIDTSQTPDELFHNDYFWSQPDGVQAMMRGGFYSSGDDAGLYSVHAGIASNFSSQAIGFRCVKSL